MKPSFAQRSLLSVVSAAAVALASTAPAAAADNAKGRQVPFTAALGIIETGAPGTSSSCALIGSISGAGLSSFGPVSLNSQDCINTDGTVFNFSSDNAVLQTAGGDT